MNSSRGLSATWASIRLTFCISQTFVKLWPKWIKEYPREELLILAHSFRAVGPLRWKGMVEKKQFTVWFVQGLEDQVQLSKAGPADRVLCLGSTSWGFQTLLGLSLQHLSLWVCDLKTGALTTRSALQAQVFLVSWPLIFLECPEVAIGFGGLSNQLHFLSSDLNPRATQSVEVF